MRTGGEWNRSFEKPGRQRDRIVQKGEKIFGACFGVVRILSVLLILTGCSHEPKASSLTTAKEAFADLRTVVRDEIKDPARAAEVASVVDQMEQLLLESAEARKIHNARMQTLIASYDAKEEDFNSAFREFNEKKRSRQDRLLAMDQRARSHTTAKEWEVIVKVGIRAIEKASLAEQGL